MVVAGSIHYWVASVEGSDGIANHVRAMIQTLGRVGFGGDGLRVAAKWRRRTATPQASGGVLAHLSRWSASLGFAVRLLARTLLDRPAVLLLSHVHFAPLAMLLGRLLDIPYVVTAHGVEIHDQLAWYRRRALCAATAVWAVSEHTASRLVGLGVQRSRISVIGNTVDVERFTLGEKSVDLLDRYGIHPQEKVLMTVSRLDARQRYKGYDAVLDVLPEVGKSVVGVRYLLVGQGADLPRIKARIEQEQLADQVILTGYVDDRELCDHYRLADVFVMPSVGEGFGIVYLEAMACGIPVLAGNIDGSVAALDGGRLGRLIDPFDRQALCRALVDMLDGQGPSLWYSKDLLRAECIKLFGSGAHEERVRQALERLLP